MFYVLLFWYEHHQNCHIRYRGYCSCCSGFFVCSRVCKSTRNNSTKPSAKPHSTFTIDGAAVTLVNGVSKVPAAPGSASMVTTRYFGNEATGDLNGDGLPDKAFLVSQDTGGSGLFYYVVVALKQVNGYKTTNAFLIGDRIAPQTTEINTSARELYVNFAERKAGEPMTTPPSVGATLYLKVTPAGVLEGLMT